MFLTNFFLALSLGLVILNLKATMQYLLLTIKPGYHVVTLLDIIIFIYTTVYWYILCFFFDTANLNLKSHR